MLLPVGNHARHRFAVFCNYEPIGLELIKQCKAL